MRQIHNLHLLSLLLILSSTSSLAAPSESKGANDPFVGRFLLVDGRELTVSQPEQGLYPAKVVNPSRSRSDSGLGRRVGDALEILFGKELASSARGALAAEFDSQDGPDIERQRRIVISLVELNALRETAPTPQAAREPISPRISSPEPASLDLQPVLIQTASTKTLGPVEDPQPFDPIALLLMILALGGFSGLRSFGTVTALLRRALGLHANPIAQFDPSTAGPRRLREAVPLAVERTPLKLKASQRSTLIYELHQLRARHQRARIVRAALPVLQAAAPGNPESQRLLSRAQYIVGLDQALQARVTEISERLAAPDSSSRNARPAQGLIAKLYSPLNIYPDKDRRLALDFYSALATLDSELNSFEGDLATQSRFDGASLPASAVALLEAGARKDPRLQSLSRQAQRDRLEAASPIPAAKLANYVFDRDRAFGAAIEAEILKHKAQNPYTNPESALGLFAAYEASRALADRDVDHRRHFSYDDYKHQRALLLARPELRRAIRDASLQGARTSGLAWTAEDLSKLARAQANFIRSDRFQNLLAALPENERGPAQSEQIRRLAEIAPAAASRLVEELTGKAALDRFNELSPDARKRAITAALLLETPESSALQALEKVAGDAEVASIAFEVFDSASDYDGLVLKKGSLTQRLSESIAAKLKARNLPNGNAGAIAAAFSAIYTTAVLSALIAKTDADRADYGKAGADVVATTGLFKDRAVAALMNNASRASLVGSAISRAAAYGGALSDAIDLHKGLGEAANTLRNGRVDAAGANLVKAGGSALQAIGTGALAYVETLGAEAVVAGTVAGSLLLAGGLLAVGAAVYEKSFVEDEVLAEFRRLGVYDDRNPDRRGFINREPVQAAR